MSDKLRFERFDDTRYFVESGTFQLGVVSKKAGKWKYYLPKDAEYFTAAELKQIASFIEGKQKET